MESVEDRLRAAIIKPKPPKIVALTELESAVYNFVQATKLVGEVPIYGATTIETCQAFPNINSNTIRYAVWSLRRKNKLVDSGVRRSLEKGKLNLTVWVCLGD